LDGEHTVQIDISSLVNGHYMVVIRDGITEKSAKLIVIK